MVFEGLAGSLRFPFLDPGMASLGNVGQGTWPLYQEEEAECV